MTSIAPDRTRRKVIIGVDTHKHIHVAVAIDQHGARLGNLAVSADSGGYAQLESWAQALAASSGSVSKALAATAPA
jgi:transposase